MMLNAAAILLISLHHKLDLQSYCELCYTLFKLWFVPHQYDLLNLCHHTTTGKCKDHSPCVPMMRTMMSTVSSLRGRSTSSGVSRP